MFIISQFEKLFYVTFALSAICGMINKDGYSDNKRQQRNEERRAEHLIIETIEIFTACVLSAAGIVVVGFGIYSSLLGRVIILLSLAVILLELFVDSFLSAKTITQLIGTSNKGIITKKDRVAVNAISYIVFYLGLFNFGTKLIELLGRARSDLIADITQLILCGALIFVYLFLSSIHLIEPLTEGAHLLQKLNLFLRSKTKIYQIGNICIGFLHNHRYCEPLLRKYYRMYKSKNTLFKVVLAIPIPIIFLADIIWFMARAIYRILLSIIGFMALLLKLFKKAIGKMVIKSKKLSERRMIALLFRVSLLTTIVIVVCWNRYYPLGRRVAESTAILEFIGSAVAIPTVFKWISEMKPRNNN